MYERLVNVSHAIKCNEEKKPIRTAISLSGRQLCKESLTFYTLKSIIFNSNLLCLKSPIMLLGAYTEKNKHVLSV